MSKIQFPTLPGTGFFGFAIDALPKKGHLKSKTMPVSRLDVTGVIPPLGLKVRMIEMILRKFVTISGKSSPILGRCGNREEDQRGDTRPPTLHGRPQPDSGAQRRVRGIGPPKRSRHRPS